MLRFLIILLVLLNVLALAAWRGWLGEGTARGEPERITNQLRPESIRVLPSDEVAMNDTPPAADAPAEASPSASGPTEPPEKAEAPEVVKPPKVVKPPQVVKPPEKAKTPEKAELAAAPSVTSPPKPAAQAEATSAPETSAPAPARADAAPPQPATPEAAAPEPPAPLPETPEPAAAPPPPVSSPAAPMAIAPPACVAFAGLTDDAARPLIEDARARSEFETRDVVSTEIESWWVVLPPLNGMTAALKRSAELRALGITDQYIIPERGSFPYGISLGLFKSAESAEQRRQELANMGVSGVQIDTRGQTVHRIEVRGPADRLSEWASSWASREPSGSRLSCRP